MCLLLHSVKTRLRFVCTESARSVHTGGGGRGNIFPIFIPAQCCLWALEYPHVLNPFPCLGTFWALDLYKIISDLFVY